MKQFLIEYASKIVVFLLATGILVAAGAKWYNILIFAAICLGTLIYRRMKLKK